MGNKNERKRRKIREYDYGNIEENNITKPLMSIIEYDSVHENIIYTDFSALNKFLETEFIPRFLIMVKNEYTDEWKSYITLNNILVYKFCEEEIEYIFNYLNQKGIMVRGVLGSFSGEFPNYEHVYSSSYLRNFQSNCNLDNQNKLFDEYQRTKNIELRNKLVEANMNLVYYIFNSSHFVDVDYIDLISFGLEGLIIAVENYNPNLGYKFSSYATKCIKFFVLKKIANLHELPINFGFKFERMKQIVEKEKFSTIESNINLIDDILKLMIQEGYIREKNYSLYRDKLLMKYRLNIEDYQEDLILSEDCNGYSYNIDLEILRDKIRDILGNFRERDREMLELYFGLNGKPRMTMPEIGNLYNITHKRVSQIIIRSIKILKTYNIHEMLDIFDDKPMEKILKI